MPQDLEEKCVRDTMFWVYCGANDDISHDGDLVLKVFVQNIELLGLKHWATMMSELLLAKVELSRMSVFTPKASDVDELAENIDHFIAWVNALGRAPEECLGKTMLSAARFMCRAKRFGKSNEYSLLAQRWVTVFQKPLSKNALAVAKVQQTCEKTTRS